MSESPRKFFFNQGDEHSKREGASIRNTALTQPCKLQPRSLVSPLSLVPIMTLSPPDTRCATHITADMLPLTRNLTLKSTTAIQSHHPEKFILEIAVGGHLTSTRGRAAICYAYGLDTNNSSVKAKAIYKVTMRVIEDLYWQADLGDGKSVTADPS
jgi:hypothetical protein